MKRFVAKLVKGFRRLGDAAESLDDFRYSIAFSEAKKTALRWAAPGGEWFATISALK